MSKASKILPFLFVAALLASCAPALPGTPLPSTGSTPAAAAPTSAAPQSGGVLRYGLTLPVSGIDPHIHASSELGIALNGVYDTLVVQDASSAFLPSLATHWDVSADGKVYTFELRKDVKFHDGNPFNAAAVVRNLERIADPATHSQKAVFLLGPFDHAEALSEFSVRITLKEPHAALLDGLSQVYLGMASPAALDQWGDQYQLHQVGTGPFRFVSYLERQELIIERNPDYAWAPANRNHSGPAYLDRVEFRFYADPATRLPTLLSRQVDVMGELPPRDAEQLRTGQVGARLIPVPIPGQSVQFMLNTTLAPLDDVRVRQGLLYVTDLPALVSSVFGSDSHPATGPLSSATRGAVTAMPVKYPYDPVKAVALFGEAGWRELDGDGYLDRGREQLTIKGVLMSWGELPAVGTILQAQWKMSGIALELEQMPYPAALEAGRKGTHHMVPFVNSGSDPGLLSTFFHSRNIGGFNWSRVQDPQVDEWLDLGARSLEWPARADAYAQVQKRVMEQAWILPIRDQVNLNGVSTAVQDLAFDIQGWFPVLYDVWLSR